MKKLTQNITGIFGDKGKIWLASLPLIVKALTEHWSLNKLVPVDNMTFNYVAKAVDRLNQPVVLKISCDEKLIRDEKQALKYFDGCGAIGLIDDNEEYNALLLQQAVPGITLKSLYPAQIEFVIDRYAETSQRLHSKLLVSKHHFQHISDWLKSIDNLRPGQLPENLLKNAVKLKNELLASSTQQKFLHGDLHLDNILKHGDDWMAIDPKGIVGEPEFDIAAFDFIHSAELESNLDIKALLEERVQRISRKTNLNARRIKDWVFVRTVLSAAWWVEDNGDPSVDIKLADRLF